VGGGAPLVALARGMVARRRHGLAAFAVALVAAALSGHLLHLPLAHMTAAPQLALVVVTVAWSVLVAQARVRQREALEREATRLADAAHDFGVRAEAWLTASVQGDELEAEALRRAVVDRHTALVAGVRAHLEGLDPHDDNVVQAMTRETERKGRHGQAVLLHLAALQREALAECQRRGLLGEARLFALDEQLTTLSGVRPFSPEPPTAAERALAIVTATAACVLVLGASERLSTTLVGALAGLGLLAFEAVASSPLGADPRIARLASW
jgi:hypothetical protein